MIAIEDKLISDDVVEVQFSCNLNACKGACCWEGDYGGPLEKSELKILEEIYPIVKNYITPEGRASIEEQGTSVYFEPAETYATPILENGACAYLTSLEKGIGFCGIQKAFLENKIDFPKPVSCHLYPIRIKKYPTYYAVNYDTWDICAAACQKGKEEKVLVYEFAKDALVSKFGKDFYTQLDDVVKGMNK